MLARLFPHFASHNANRLSVLQPHCLRSSRFSARSAAVSGVDTDIGSFEMPRGTYCDTVLELSHRAAPLKAARECTNLPEEPLLVIVQAWQPPHATRTPLICVNGLPIS